MKKDIMLILMFFMTSCKTENLQQNHIERFNKNKHQFENLIEELKQDTLFNKKSEVVFKWTYFQLPTREKLQELGIEEVVPFYWDRTQRQFDLKTNWGNKIPIHIYYNTLDTIVTKKGYYNKDENSNEFWGLGNPWCLWYEVKLIKAKR
jgi:hypothetical protein